MKEAVGRKTAALELPETNISNSVALFNKAVLEAAKMSIPRGRRCDYQLYWTPELDILHKVLYQTREKKERSPTKANVKAHSRGKADCCHEKTASLSMGKRHDRSVESDKNAKQ